ncbi:MAG: F420-dependent NADP oxidoreductase [Bacteroidia bacterium]
MIENVVIIGAGNLATQIALALTEKGIQVKQIFSRNLDSARELAEKTGAAYTNDLSALLHEADLYVIAVKDSAIQEVLENLSLDENRMIVHTAGSVPMNILDGFSINYGVFYPVQTFSKNRKIDFLDIPICIEANHPANLMKLQELASKLSSSVHQINSDDRKTLHLAALFANNFVNHFYSIGESLLQNKKLNFDLLKPLIRETAEKIESIPPADAQTGPAKRNDQIVINEHIKMLQDQPDLQKIYRLMTESIFQFHQNQKHDLL